MRFYCSWNIKGPFIKTRLLIQEKTFESFNINFDIVEVIIVLDVLRQRGDKIGLERSFGVSWTWVGTESPSGESITISMSSTDPMTFDRVKKDVLPTLWPQERDRTR